MHQVLNENLRSWLTDDERQTLDRARRTYDQVMAWNLRAQYEAQDDAQRERSSRPLDWWRLSAGEREQWLAAYRQDPFGIWAAQACMLAGLVQGGLGGKSALLNRLTRGERPLRYAPPTSYSYPHYGLVDGEPSQSVSSCYWMPRTSLAEAMTRHQPLPQEEVAELRVIVERQRSAAAQAESRFGAASLVIGQTTYRVTGANDAGERLLRASVKMVNSPDGFSPSDEWDEGQRAWVKVPRPAITRDHPLWEEVLLAYQDRPEIQVAFGSWPAWTLRLGRTQGSADQEWVELAKDRPFGRKANLHPMDLTFALLDARVEGPDDDTEADPKVGDLQGGAAAATPQEEASRRIAIALRGEDPNVQRTPGPIGVPFDEEKAAPFIGRRRPTVLASWFSWELSRGSAWDGAGSSMYIEDDELNDPGLDPYLAALRKAGASVWQAGQ